VDVQQVAARKEKILSWIGNASTTPAAASPAMGTLSEPDAERRQLTVMFCDLVGSTDLSQRLDAEDLRSVVRSYQEAASRVIERYAGHVAQYRGDRLLVYFGHPQAHEDDAERAVRAGLEILAALRTLNDTLEPAHGIRLTARVGIHTGPVVIGAMGGGAKIEALALGDTANIAARLEASAAPSTVVLCGAAQRLVSGLFVRDDLGTPALEGVATPVRAYAALPPSGVRSRLDVAAGWLTRFVGREVELATLVERWERAADGEGRTC
jgi:class 3 adenylate cyclase